MLSVELNKTIFFFYFLILSDQELNTRRNSFAKNTFTITPQIVPWIKVYFDNNKLYESNKCIKLSYATLPLFQIP